MPRPWSRWRAWRRCRGVLKVLNRAKIPVYPISTGKNLGYGSAAPVQRAAGRDNLRRMNRIPRSTRPVHRAGRAGVTYQQLRLPAGEEAAVGSCPALSAIAGPVATWSTAASATRPRRALPVLLRHGGGARRRPVAAHRHGLDAELQHPAGLRWGYGPTLTASSRSRNRRGHQDGHVFDAGAAGLPALLHPVPDEADITKIVDAAAPAAHRDGDPERGGDRAHAVEAPCTPVKRADYQAAPARSRRGGGAHPPRSPHRRLERLRGLYGTPRRPTTPTGRSSRRWPPHRRAHRHARGRRRQGARHRFDLMRGKPNLGEFGLCNWRGGGGFDLVRAGVAGQGQRDAQADAARQAHPRQARASTMSVHSSSAGATCTT